MGKWILRTLALFFITLFITYTVSNRDPVEKHFEVSQMVEEAKQSPVIKLLPSGASFGKKEGLITLTLEEVWSRPSLIIKVDGKPVGDFKQKQVTLRVTQGQQISLEDIQSDSDTKIDLSHSTRNIEKPKEGTLELKNSRIYLSKVEILTP